MGAQFMYLENPQQNSRVFETKQLQIASVCDPSAASFLKQHSINSSSAGNTSPVKFQACLLSPSPISKRIQTLLFKNDVKSIFGKQNASTKKFTVSIHA
jgi:hypothetical protein